MLPHREILWNKNKFQFSLLFVSFQDSYVRSLSSSILFSGFFPLWRYYSSQNYVNPNHSAHVFSIFPGILKPYVFYFCSEKSEIFIKRPWKEGKKQWRLPICWVVDDDTSTQILTFSIYCHFTVHTILTEPNWSSIHRVTSPYTI